ncbi:MAG TPA: hypothetical protein VKZ91_14025 [Woeseiaceae bacterium]|nr:hypothetical protein [Woeseiaceae bacterium]
MRRNFPAELYRRNPLLTLVGGLHIVLLLATFVGLVTDDRLIMGVNAWLKPAKFMFSIAVYVWTVAWFSKYIRRPRWLLSSVSVVISATMIVESTCILLQAARGTTSHYNVATDFDAAIFQTMGIMIGIDMFMAVVILFMFSRPSIRLRPVYLWSIRAGIVIFLAGGAIGGTMVAHGAHTFGAPDGGPGLPFLNWSTVGGDLRIAHGLALHALQILPLTGYAISCWSAVPRTATKFALLAIVVVAYAAAVFMLYRQGIAGTPLFS